MATRFGVFGKIPGNGDFVQAGLPREFVRTWDTWLQQGLMAARAQLGELWADAYYSAPCWRFLLPPGVAGAEAVQGVLMPSVDRVGRQFPLTLAVALPDGVPPLAMHFHSAALLDALETLALSALDADVTLAEIEAGLARLSLPVEGAAQASPGRSARLVSRASGAGALPDLAATLIGPAGEGVSLWSMRTEEASQAFAAPGLPEPAIAVHLFYPFDRPAAREAMA
ncbi:MAG: type VI secretion system-associated protein TagF [Pseudomonadota bacterium]